MNKTLKENHEMKDSGIEWIGKIPNEWNLTPLKAILKERKEKNTPIKTTNILSLTIDKGVIPYSEKSGGGNKAKEDLSAYKITYPNDIVINSMNVIAGAVGLSKYFGAVSPVYYTLYANEETNNIGYFNKIFQTQVFQKSLMGLGNGIMIKESGSGKLNTIRLRIPMEKLKGVTLPVPPIHKQQAIANYLDDKIEKIDQLIAEQKQAIESWKEYKQSLITETVTKGLKSNVEMKDSGNEWIGKVPKEWGIVPLNKVCTYQEGPGIMSADFEESGVPLIRISGMKGNTVSLNGCNYLNPRKVKQKWEHFKLNLGDILISASASTGIVATVDESTVGCIPYTGLIRFKAGSSIANSYLKYFIESDIYIEQINIQKTGTTIHHYGPSHLRKVKFVLPPLNEQQSIVDFLDEKCSKIDQTIEQKQLLIKQLEEYKQSLIYECVTGKRCVL